MADENRSVNEVRDENRSVSANFTTHEGVKIAIGVSAWRKTLNGQEGTWSDPIFHLNTYTARLAEVDVTQLLELAIDLFALYHVRFVLEGKG